MQRALVLSGGGARGSYQVGMLKELILNQGLDFQVIRGVSVGSLNAAFLAEASTDSDSLGALQQRVRDLEHLWTVEITGNDSVYKGRFGGVVGLATGADSLHSFKPLKRLLDKHVDVEALRTSGRDFSVGTVSLVSGLYREWMPTDEPFRKFLLASSAIPVVFPFQDFEERQDVLVDGGVRNVSPLGSAFASGADEIYLLLASRLERTANDEVPASGTQAQDYDDWDDNLFGTKVGGFQVLLRTVDLLSDEVYLDDIRNALKWNRICAAVASMKSDPHFGHEAGRAMVDKMQSMLDEEDRRHVELKIIAPREWFGTENDSTQFDPKLIAAAITHGETVASDQTKWFWPPA